MPLEKSPMRDDRAAERIVVKHEPDLHSGQREHDGCQRGSRDRFGDGEGPPAHGFAGHPGFNEERDMDESESCKNNHQRPI